MAAGRMATAGGHVYLLLAASLSLGIITVIVAFTSNTLGGDAFGGKAGLEEKRKSGGIFRVLR